MGTPQITRIRKAKKAIRFVLERLPLLED